MGGGNIFHDFREAGRPVIEEHIVVPVVAHAADLAAQAVTPAFVLPAGPLLAPKLVDRPRRDG